LDRNRLYRTEAIVLRRSDFGEADRLLVLYTPDFGKLRVLAKGVRKLTSRKSGHLELLTRSRLLMAKGRNLDIVSQAETIDAFRPLREDLHRTSYACYVAELLDRFTEEGVESRPLYDLLLAALGWLGESEDLALTARFYELRLLALAGYQPQLFYCVSCRRSVEPVSNYFAPGDGGVLCPRCGQERRGVEPVSLNALKVLRFLQTRDYNTCRALRISPALHRELETIMQRYIVYHLERRLKSVEFLDTLRREGMTGV
jgi:DNA repair protein RecO (recombination protein O)